MTESIAGSPQARIVQIERLLHHFNTTHANDNVAPARSRRIHGRPILTACLAFFVFAPGCAAAAAFLLRNDGTMPPLLTPGINPPQIAKSDRLSLNQWSTEANQKLAVMEDVRIAAAIIAEDVKSLESISIRGSLEDGTLTTFSDATSNAMALAEEPVAPPPRRRAKK